MQFTDKNIKQFLVMLIILFWSKEVLAFACKDSTGQVISSSQGGGGVFTVFANLTPSVSVGQNLVVDLSGSISCYDQDTTNYIDWVSLQSGSAYGGALTNFNGTVDYNGTSYPFPLTGSTSDLANRAASYIPWPVQLYLTPVSTASGVVINSGELIAVLHMHKYSTNPSTGQVNGTIDNFTWNIYASNSVVVPTGGCDVSARDVTVTLPEYPGSATAIPLTVHCAQDENLAYYLTGTTADSAGTIFTNTSSSSAATGVGVQLSDSRGAIPVNTDISLGTVGTTPVNLGLTANYARTSGQVTAGNVQSVIGVTFVYQ